jgi:hypothetical protein
MNTSRNRQTFLKLLAAFCALASTFVQAAESPRAAGAKRTTYLATCIAPWKVSASSIFTTHKAVFCLNPNPEPAEVTATYYFEDAAPETKTITVDPNSTKAIGHGDKVAAGHAILGVKIESDRHIGTQHTLEFVSKPTPLKPGDTPSAPGNGLKLELLTSYLSAKATAREFLISDVCTSGKPADDPKRTFHELQYFTIVNPNSQKAAGTFTGYYRNGVVKSTPLTVQAERVICFEVADIGHQNIESYEKGRLMSAKITFDQPVAVLQTRTLRRGTGEKKDMPIFQAFEFMVEGEQ